MFRRPGDKAPLLLDDGVAVAVAANDINCLSDVLSSFPDVARNGLGKAYATEPDVSDEVLHDVVGVFVVAFDTRHGNIVEWFAPDDLDINGIEFKAMASGAHRTTTDFIYFKRGAFFGLASFEKLDVENTSERGARMKSVGVLTRSYSLLHMYKVFLQKQVRHLLENQGSYGALSRFYQRKRSLVYGASGTMTEVDLGYEPTLCEGLPQMEITHPAGCFSQFLNYFGDKIFALWRFALLRKRILFFSQPPIGVVCFRVYCTSTLVAHVHPGVDRSSALCPPQFYVNIADIDSIEKMSSYVACTTEKIFENKLGLYDLYVDQQNLRTSKLRHQKLLETNLADRIKFRHLNDLRSKSQLPGGSCDADESWFTSFFMAQNTQLFKELHLAQTSETKILGDDHMRRAGLDPLADKPFVAELADVYGIDIVLVNDGVCCAR
ncbi:protein LCHN [Galendromus occidentalis]|uniref:DENN domain-containing protein 11 n=1 Tax=Galendromus occidentalis TaxID=34638 RepID=A0AAJ6QQT3_9ACAR|nr:protein LCHN [Galendromus occidentalis]